MTVLLVPAGEFLMRAAVNVADAPWQERPQHAVYLDALWIDQTEVTNDQYGQCVAAGVCEAPASCDFGVVAYDDETRANHPVVCVNWYDAQTYCSWVGGQLPTEAQWEKAARGIDGRSYPWGEGIECSMGNFDDETAVDAYAGVGGVNCDGYPQTAPVGTYPATRSPYGALDMAGNVWEWVNDWCEWGYYDRSPYRNPAGPEVGEMRGVRGGSFHYGVSYMHTYTRHMAPPEHRADALGFRCALPAD